MHRCVASLHRVATCRYRYAAVLDVNERCIAACRADGSTSLSALHRLSLQWTYEHLVSLVA